jgi:subtilase family serine protease
VRSKVRVYEPGPRPRAENAVVEVNESAEEFEANVSVPTIDPPDKIALAALSEANVPDRLERELSVNVVV